MDGYKEFLELRQYLFNKLSEMDMQYCKNYEGEFDISFCYDNYFEVIEKGYTTTPSRVTLALHCYVIGPSRHYMWQGKTLLDSVKKARKDIEEWCKEATDED